MMDVPFYTPDPVHRQIRQEVMDFFESFYDSNWYVLGETVSRFEQTYAAFNQVHRAVGVANGLDAIQIALRSLQIGPGDEVIVPSNTYIASWLGVSNVGATPVPVEPDPATWNIDPDRIEAAITPRTRVIMPVHLYGQPCRMDRIMEIAGKHHLLVVEDNAQAHGGKFLGRLTGSFGDINATSFYPTKNLGALGDAGALTTNNEQLADFALSYRNYGSSRKYYNEVAGVNSRLDTFQAGILLIKLRYLETWNRQRQSVASRYLESLNGVGDLQLPEIAPGCEPVWHLFVVRSAWRDRLQEWLRERAVQTMIHYPVPPHLQQAYADLGYRQGQFPLAERIAGECLSLPIFPGMTVEQADYVCAAIRSFFKDNNQWSS